MKWSSESGLTTNPGVCFVVVTVSLVRADERTAGPKQSERYKYEDVPDSGCGEGKIETIEMGCGRGEFFAVSGFRHPAALRG